MLDQLLTILQHGPQTCVKLLPASEMLPLYQALVCGVSLDASEERRLFVDSGLIHILVVSGAHLHFLEQLLYKLPGRWIQNLILVFYGWLTGFGAPIIKALVRRALRRPLSVRGWSTIQQESAAVLITLLAIPEWWGSRSFLMSWICALALAMPQLVPGRHFDAALKVHGLMYLFTAGSIWSVAWNALLAPVIGGLLFPLCLASTIFHPLVVLSDGAWNFLLMLLRLGMTGAPAEWFIPATRLLWWPVSLNLILLIGEVRWRRARAFS